jgi:hypothetical protein
MKSALISTALVGLLLASATQAGPGACKVTVCHLPSGDVEKLNAIEVGVAALDAHLAHGDFMGFQGACYVLVDVPMHLGDAEDNCQAIGGHLVSIHSQEENDYVGTLADMATVATGRVWIGAIGDGPDGDFCSGSAGVYEWTDGSPWDYENWRTSTNEPNGCGTAPPKDAVMFFAQSQGANYGWNDVRADGPMLASVCKLD